MSGIRNQRNAPTHTSEREELFLRALLRLRMKEFSGLLRFTRNDAILMQMPVSLMLFLDPAALLRFAQNDKLGESDLWPLIKAYALVGQTPGDVPAFFQ